ncbi:hypothetical protein ACWGWN_20770, partial [Klebsiella pneumoniae]
PGIISAQLAKNTTKITINVFTHVFSRLFAICDIFHCIFLSMNRSFFAKLMAECSIFRCAF